ncbi:MAG: group II intron maturase-specific domain-containing protein [Bacillota bacterium]
MQTGDARRGIATDERIRRLNHYLRGWLAYFHVADALSALEDIEGWLHRRLRACVWKQWKRPHTRYRELRALGLPAWVARQYAESRRGFWRMAGGPLNQALPRSYWQRQGLLDLVDSYRRLRYA